jgi:hypothetical protein
MRLVPLLLLLAGAAAARQAPAVDLDAIGPKVGETVSDFELRDAAGTPRRLSALLGPKGAMLVFYRSADW